MITLSIDTSKEELVLELFDDEKNKTIDSYRHSNGTFFSLTGGNKNSNAKPTHSADIIPSLENILKKNNLSYSDIQKIGVASGPGSFTGIRIGVTVAKTLAYFLNIPLVSFGILDSYANSFILDEETKINNSTKILSVSDARNDMFFVSEYETDKKQVVKPIDTKHLNIKEIIDYANNIKEKYDVFIVGEVDKFKENNANNFNLIKGRKNNVLGIMTSNFEEVDDIIKFSPNYFRKTQSQLKWEEDQKNSNPDNLVEKLN